VHNCYVTISTSAILLVEHNPSLRTFARKTLKRHGFTVLEASGGVEGIAVMLCYEGTIPLAIVEIIMPGVDGLDFVNRLHIERPQTEILYISALGHSIAVDSILQRKPDSMLMTPFTADVLIERVRQLVPDTFTEDAVVGSCGSEVIHGPGLHLPKCQ
jgi:two-component system cell cycle sensor histidine kinase/response regulator CckA